MRRHVRVNHGEVGLVVQLNHEHDACAHQTQVGTEGSDVYCNAGSAVRIDRQVDAWVYLHAFSLLTGILGAATVVGAFLTGWPSIIAVILNYVKRNEARGTWVESHFRWQIRTFWFGLLWIGICVLFIIMTLGIGILIAWLPMLIVGFWFIYRTLRGMGGAERPPAYLGRFITMPRRSRVE